MKRARIITVMPATINRIGASAIATGVGGVVVGAFSSSSITAGIVGSLGGGIIMGGVAVCAELGTDTKPVMVPIPWPVPMPTVTVAEPRREPAAWPPEPGQCFVCGIIDPDREKSLDTATHPECVEWLGDWKPSGFVTGDHVRILSDAFGEWKPPVPHFERNRPPIILPSRTGITMSEFANNMRGIVMEPVKPTPTPVESTADAVRRNAHRCTVLCARESHGDGPHDLCKCSTCVNNRGDSPTEQEIRDAYDDLNSRYADRMQDLRQRVQELREETKALKSGRLRRSLDGHTAYPADMPPPHVLGYTAYPRHGYYINGVCQACKLIADYTARPQWISKLPPFEPDPDLTRRFKE